jgi:hypothetical protein
MKRLAFLAAFACLCGCALPGAGRAGIISVTSPAILAPNDSIDWGQLGPDSAAISSPQAVTSGGGLGASVSTTDPQGFIRFDQGNDWHGNFAPGDRLIDNYSGGMFPLTVAFASPVRGAGANIEPDEQTTFTATIEAFDGSTSLGTFTEAGVSNGSADGSAIFIGVLDTNAEITSIVFGLTNVPSDGGNFAINSVRLVTPAVTAAPEPASLTLLGTGAAGLLGYGWRRKRAQR